MIISKIQGGLGNQMFQYAYGRHLSHKYQTVLYIDDRFYTTQSKRQFELDKFNVSYFSKDLNSIQVNYPILKITDDFSYKKIPPPNDCNYYLDGYWQSEKYFTESEDIIRSDFTPNQYILDKIKNTPLTDNSLSLHIRRTDYVTSNGFHPVQPIKYYQDAIDCIGDYGNIFVFSDDIQWCRDNLKFDKMIFMDGFGDIEDMFVMSMCTNNIICNSSFSWWGAWLNKNENKKVIAPKNWFGIQANLNDSDIVPQKWIKI